MDGCYVTFAPTWPKDPIAEKFESIELRLEEIQSHYISRAMVEILIKENFDKLWDEIRNSEARILSLIKYAEEGLEKCFERIEKLEAKLIEIEKHFSGDYQLISTKLTPHKCPVCDGRIKILIDPSTPLSGIQAMFGKRDLNGMYYEDCNACESKGIVWG